jgi:predicted lipoprotein with Yx(FWY)xxD motif
MRRAVMMAAIFVLTAGAAYAGTLGVAQKEGVGKYLTDEKGMTLYLFTKDSAGKSVCAGGCVDRWPLFFDDSPKGEGLAAADFAVITREDGKKQTTYKGRPLYYFFKDAKAGDTAGQGLNGVWYAAAP